jgi:hypothetical protein
LCCQKQELRGIAWSRRSLAFRGGVWGEPRAGGDANL